MARISLTKCQGTGNDFVLLDRTAAPQLDYAALAPELCDRNFGVGADGVLVLERPTDLSCDVALRIFNADGSTAEMCGNGARCVARYMHDRTSDAPRRIAIQAPAGVVRTEIVDDPARFAVRVAMGVPTVIRIYDRERAAGISGDFADVVIGNPHTVMFVDLDLMTIDLPTVANAVAAGTRFEDGVNVEVARIFKSGPVALRVFERGVGETLACGTGACAVAVAAIEMKRATSPVRVTMQGGEVFVDWQGPGEQAYLTGGAELIFDTTIDVNVDVAEVVM